MTTGDLMAVPIDIDSARNPVGGPVRMFSPRLCEDFFDPAADGKRFLLVERIDPDVRSITLIQNWATTSRVD